MFNNTLAHNEKRRFQRLPETLPVRFRFSDRTESAWSEAKSLNISEGGLFVSHNLSLESIGNIVHLDLQLHREGKPMRLICQVAWVKRKQDSISGVGLEIIQIDEKQKQTLLLI